MKNLTISLFSIAMAMMLTQPVSAIPINNNSDWGINSADFSSSEASVYWIAEDQHSNYLDPGYGGQNYDVEAIYTTWDTNKLYVSIITGRKQNPGGGWAPGDIAFDLGQDGTFEYGLVTSNANGSYPASNGIGNPGDFYSVSEWNYGIWDAAGNHVGFGDPQADKDHPTSVKDGSTAYSDVGFSYDNIGTGYGSWGGDTHYMISTAIDLNQLGGINALMSGGFSVHWAALCNNDWLQLDVPTQTVSEPPGLLLLGLGFLGLVVTRKKLKANA